MRSEIKITNSGSGVTTVDIEGTIGVPEEWQFEEPAGRIATYEKFQRTLTAIGRIRGGEVVVNIRSTGGDVGDALLIHDALAALKGGFGRSESNGGRSEGSGNDGRGSGNDGRNAGQAGPTITTRCFGYVASAATIIAQAASEGRREISANSLYLVHNSVANCEGNAGDFRQNEELLTKTDRRIAAIYAARSGREEEEFLALMAENNGSGRWLSPEEALAAGLADRIVDAAPIDAGNNGGKGRGGLRKKSRELPDNSSRADLLRMQQDVELEKLRHRISTLEGENAQLRARPTETKIKEDPSPTSEGRRSANYTAYERDVEGFH
jgi:ATP-dependent protease ClpP protease subunit